QPSPELRHELRNEALAALVLPDAEVAREWDGWPDGTWNLVCDAALQRYARMNRDGSVTVYRLTKTGTEDLARLVAPGPPFLHRLWMSPDGRHVAVTYARPGKKEPPALVVWRLDGRAARKVLDEPATQGGVAFPSRGALLAVSQDNRSVTVFD